MISGILHCGCSRNNMLFVLKGLYKQFSDLETFGVIHLRKCSSFSRSHKELKEFESPPELSASYRKVAAYATAGAYNLCKLAVAIKNHDVYVPCELSSDEELRSDVKIALHAIAKRRVPSEDQHIYYFKEGTVVMWNVGELEERSVIEFLKPFQENSYHPRHIFTEKENMRYQYVPQSKKTFIQEATMYLGTLEKSPEDVGAFRYALSNALALSVKLGVLESVMDQYIQEVESLTNDLQSGKPLRLGQNDVIRKSGKIYALRHSVNLSTDLLGTPDFYWQRETLEDIYLRSCSYYGIPRRTKVLNEKVNNCVELMHLVSSLLTDRHHVRLEWIIIVLIAMEIVFEVIHYYENK